MAHNANNGTQEMNLSREKVITLIMRNLKLNVSQYQASGAPVAIACQNCGFRCGFVPDRPGRYEVLCGCRTFNIVTIQRDGTVSTRRKTKGLLDFVPEEFISAFRRKLESTRGSHNYLISITNYKLHDKNYEVKGKLSYLTDYDRMHVEELQSKIARLELIRSRMPNLFAKNEERELRRAKDSLLRIGLRYTFTAVYYPLASTILNYEAEYQIRD
jgi:hypothetical protein